MKIKKAMILAAGLGNRMKPITSETPKPLIPIGKKNLLERAINLLISYGIKEITINVHHLSEKIKKFILDAEYNLKISISEEKEELLDTGGGVFNATKNFGDEPFIVINPDTLWNENYKKELESLEKLYFKHKKPSLLLVSKNLSFDKSFKGDFNIDKNRVINREKNNSYIFTGLQILNRSIFDLKETRKVFSMNEIWDNLISSSNLIGFESKQKFYHINTKEIYDKILKLNIID